MNSSWAQPTRALIIMMCYLFRFVNQDRKTFFISIIIETLREKPVLFHRPVPHANRLYSLSSTVLQPVRSPQVFLRIFLNRSG